MKATVEVEFPDGPTCDGCVFLRRYDLGAKSQCLLTGYIVAVTYNWAKTTDIKTEKAPGCPGR